MSEPTERIAPLSPPYPDRAAGWLERAMPGRAPVDPLRLFRIFVKHPALADAMQPLGAHLLGAPAVAGRERELLILRTCARCGSEYEWGVHVTAFARRFGLTDEKIAGTVHWSWEDERWSSKERTVLRLADELHQSASASDELWRELSAHFDAAQIVELLVLVGFYHSISYLTNALQVANEEGAERFPRPQS